MIIAVTTEGNEIFQHFGSCKTFTLYEIDNQKIVNKKLIHPTEGGHSSLAIFMKENNVDIVICGGIGGGAKNALRANRIEIVPGVTGNIEEAVIQYLSGIQIGNPDFICNHSHEGDSHGCGHHEGNGCHCS